MLELKSKILLASKSPRRRQLLTDAGIEYQIVDIHCDEDFPRELQREEIATFLSELKSKHYEQSVNSGEILLTADTIVWCAGEVLNKPADHEEAVQVLSKISGTNHEVITGVSLRSADRTHTFSETTEVHFRKLSREEIDHYIEHEHPFDKAGAYGIQDWIGKVGIDRINGCYYNVVGLPLARLISELHKFEGA
jgi:septum formation protein